MGARGTWKGCNPVRLEAFIRNSGLSYKTGSKSYIFTCPLCRKEEILYISRSTGRFICFVCAQTKRFKGAPEFALKALTGQSVSDIREALYGTRQVQAGGFLNIRFNDLVDEDDDVDLSLDEDVDLPDLTWPYHCYPLDHEWSAPGVAYLEGRGIPADVAMQYDIRYSTKERSVGFPVWVGDKLVGWQLRTIDPETILLPDDEVVRRLKILSSEDIPRERYVMFSNRLIDHAVLCEGPVDALKAHLVGGNVATMGKAVSHGQIEMLLNTGIRKLYVALDPDAAAELEPLLAKFGNIPAYKVVVPRPYKDLGAMPLEGARDTILGAQELKRCRIHVYFKNADLVLPPKVG